MLYYTTIDVLAWSREGCETRPKEVSGTVKCECTHLTNFALLLADDQSETTTQLELLNQVGELLFSSCLVRFKRRNPAEAQHRLNLYKTFRRLSGLLLNVLCTSNLHHTSSEKCNKITFGKIFDYFCPQLSRKF